MFRWTVKVDVGVREIFKGVAGAAVDRQLYTFQRCCYFDDDSEGTEIYARVFNTVSLRWGALSMLRTGTVRHSIFGYLWRDPHRKGHSAVAIGRLIYVWGGPCPHSGVLHVFDVDANSWSEPEVSGAVPKGKSGHSACALEKAMFIYGGEKRAMKGDETNGIFKLDTDTMVWSLIDTRGTSPPSFRDFSTATIMGSKMFVFGDTGDKQIGVFEFDTETNLWTSTPSFQEQEHSMRMSWFQSAFAYNGELYVTDGGGFCEILTGERNSSSNYLWRFNPVTLSWTKFKPKGNGPAHLRCVRCCMVGDRVVFFDGDAACPNKLWILDLRPSLKTLCKEAFIQHGLEQSELPHDVRWELAAMTETDPEARVLPSLCGNETTY